MRKTISIIGKLVSTLIVFGASGCSVQSVQHCFPGKAKRIDEIVLSETKYLPNNHPYDEVENNKLAAKQLSRHLIAMNEPSLLVEARTSEEVYRFTWLRTFDEPYSFRLLREGDKVILIVKSNSGKGGYEPGTLRLDSTKNLSASEWKEFQVRLENSCFWGMQSWDNILGFDGSSWTLEAVREGKYHIVTRWTPTGGDFRRACKYLIDLAAINPTEMY